VCCTAYSAGLRIGEACRLKPVDVDSARGLIHVHEGKGKKDRDVMVSEGCSLSSASHRRICRPQGEWLAPSNHWPNKPVDVRTVREAF
jgi:integrase